MRGYRYKVAGIFLAGLCLSFLKQTETELLPSKWLDGPYALLMPTDGCPETANHGWGTGVIHLTTVHKMRIMREFDNSDGYTQITPLSENASQLAGPFEEYSLRLNFCFKHASTSVGITTLFPLMNMTVYGDMEGCPLGFVERMDYMPLPHIRSWWTDGDLPYFDIHTAGNDSVLITKHCSLQESSETTSEVNFDKPFISVKAQEERCPSPLEGLDIEEEALLFLSLDEQDGHEAPRTNISFCVYKPEIGHKHHEDQLLYTDSHDSLFDCYNNGTVIHEDNTHQCICPTQYTGILCETELLPSKWLDGPYALLLPTDGCPETANHGWGTGVIHLTTVHRMKIRREFYYSGGFVQRTSLSKIASKLAGPFQDYSLRLNFCFKHANTSVGNSTLLPLLNMTVYGDMEGCPLGFVEEDHYLPLPRIRSWWTDGYLPYFDILNDDTDSVLITKHCSLQDSSETTSEVIYGKPFISVKAHGESCPLPLEGIDIRQETLLFSSLDEHDVHGASHTRISFCVYKPIEIEELYPSSWPNGPYALPMLNTGCPESTKHGWAIGYIKLKKLKRSNEFSSVHECTDVTLFETALELYNPDCLQYFFCYKYGEQDSQYEIGWPIGSYAIFSAPEGCPEGFNESARMSGIYTTNEYEFLTSGGMMPDFEWTMLFAEVYKLSFTVCERMMDYEENSTSWENPFALVKGDNSTCEPVADITPKTIYWVHGQDLCLYIPDERIEKDNTSCGFVCDDQCLPNNSLCDGVKNCEDGLDELDCKQNISLCNHCWGVHCLHNRLVNSADPDETAPVGAVSSGSSLFTECYDYEFKCGSGECIKKTLICDEVKDCKDGSDEHGSNCDKKCQQGELFCQTDGICYPMMKVLKNSGICPDRYGPAMCPPGEIYTGRYRRREKKWPICMIPGKTSRKEFCGFDDFCRNSDRCDRVKKVCDEMMSLPDELMSLPGLVDGLQKPHLGDLISSCDKALGLADGSINNSQITAPQYLEGHPPEMVRPSLTSWCISANASNPYIETLMRQLLQELSHPSRDYLQVDLGSVAVVRGIIVYNGINIRGKSVNNSFIPEVIPVGCSTFSVHHAMYQSRFKRYFNTSFEIDRSLAIEIPQRIPFLRPFLARYVRIYPEENILNGNLCLRMELLGCSQSGLHHRRINLKIVDETNLLITGPYELGMHSNYPSNSIYRWNIKVPDGGFIKLSFLEINLHSQSARLAGDCTNDILSFDDIFEPISPRYNGLTPVYPTDITTIAMTFVVCLRKKQGHSNFFVMIDKTDVPTIWGQIKDVNMLEGNLISLSLLGLFHLSPSTLKWHLRSYVYGRRLLFSFQRINIPCDTDDFRLSISSDIYWDSKLCNTEKKPRKIYRDWSLHVLFKHKRIFTLRDPEGFSASFQIEPPSDHHKWFHQYEGYVPKTYARQFGVYTVHSETLNKDYIFSYQKWFEDWLTHAHHCQQQGYRLVTIHGGKEMEFLQSWLTYRISKLFKSRGAGQREYLQSLKFYTHIGLLRHEGTDGLTDIWTDGTSLSYSSWDTGEPWKTEDRRCSGMFINITTGEGRWVTRLCREDRIVQPGFLFASLCEKPINDKLPAGKIQPTGSDTFSTVTLTEKLHICGSGELVSPIATCDGFPDCQDYSDENDCAYNETDDCSEDEFKCNDGECISIAQVCDFFYDCQDGADEYCTMPPCQNGEFTCENSQCIPYLHRCDAVQDCVDGSDEKLCYSCNETKAYSCGDATCIDIALRCNNIPDCRDGRDENDCEQTFDTCEELWLAGYDDNAVLYHNESYIECQFHINGTELIATLSVEIMGQKGEWINVDNFEQRKLYADDYTAYGDTCSLEITATCPEYRMQLGCSSETYAYAIESSRFEDLVNRTTELIYNEQYSLSIGRYSENETYTIISPAMCNTIAASINVDDVVRCKDGSRVGYVPAGRNKCLYDKKRTGIIDGCLNYKHLEDCENFTCPGDYFKCPYSFCLARQYVCDGERQCPTGDDENHCWCDSNSSVVAVLFNKYANKHVVPYIYRFSRQLYSDETPVYMISYYFDTQTYTFTVNKTLLHPYSQDLYLGVVEHFKVAKYALYESIIDILQNLTGINIINIDQNAWASFKGKFPNSTSVDTVYRITIDSTLRERVQQTSSETETILKIQSWKELATAGSALFPKLCQVKLNDNCRGRYRCLSSRVCIPVDLICDGIPQCPFEDDEKMCDFHCHKKCRCGLYSADCRSDGFTIEHFVQLESTVRTLDVSGSAVAAYMRKLTIPKMFPHLITFVAIDCYIIYVTEHTFLNAINMKYLDLSYNCLKSITNKTFTGLKHLEVLKLEGNYFIESIQPKSFQMFSKLSALIITRTQISEINPDTFFELSVNTLDISTNKIRRLHSGSFNKLSAIEINFDENDIDTFDADVFSGINTTTLKKIRSPAFKFCCFKPNSLPDENCLPQQDEFSSCEDLMRNPILQTLIWVLGAAAIAANGSTVCFRLCYERHTLHTGFGMFVTNLAVSDFLMGIYLIIIAIADISFRERYIMMDDYWRHSGWCDLAGILAAVSSEASVLFMCLITLDRLLVIKYPFGQWRFGKRSSRIATLVSWIVSLIIALVPILIKDYFQGKFYSTSGVCLALPLTHRRPPGWLYSFLINVGLNFVAFILIAIGQLVIYLEIRKTSKRMKKVRSQRRNDIRIAKNLVLVLLTDFFCWFPIGVMAIMAANGYVIPGEMYAWTAVLIVPINAALNPFLYTLSAAMRRKTSSTSSTTSVAREVRSKVTLALNIDSADSKIQCNIEVSVPDKPDIATVPAFKSLADIPAGQATFDTREVLSIYIVIAGTMATLHGKNFVFGGFSIENIWYNTQSGKICVMLPVPVRASKGDKGKDTYDVGRVMEHVLKFTKSPK